MGKVSRATLGYARVTPRHRQHEESSPSPSSRQQGWVDASGGRAQVSSRRVVRPRLEHLQLDAHPQRRLRQRTQPRRQPHSQSPGRRRRRRRQCGRCAVETRFGRGSGSGSGSWWRRRRRRGRRWRRWRRFERRIGDFAIICGIIARSTQRPTESRRVAQSEGTLLLLGRRRRRRRLVRRGRRGSNDAGEASVR